jgi:CrcB protein
MKLVWIGAAGFAGAVSRYQVEGWVSARTRGAFPWGTFVVNVSGCVLIGFLVALLTERFAANPTLRVALTVGFVGAYTTFSTFAYETMRLSDHGRQAVALAYVVASVIAGVAAVMAGTSLGRAL